MSGENKNEMITMSLADLDVRERLAVVEAGHEILVEDFQKSRDHLEEMVVKIFDKVDEIPDDVTDCKDTLEKDIKDTYMSKSAGELMESRFNSSVRSIKLWIVSSVTGATGAGVIALWLLNIKII